MNQIEELLGMIKDHRDVGVSGASVMYTWLSRQIQPLQKCSRFGFEYLGNSDPSRFFADPVNKGEVVLRVSCVFMGADTLSYVPTHYSVKKPPKQVGVSSRVFLSSTSSVLYSDWVLTELEILLQDDINVYRGMPPMLDIEHLSHLMPSRPTVDSVSKEDDEGTDDDCTLADVMKGKKSEDLLGGPELSLW
jgi:hypothetical protein